ncbi:MAG: insulinase family protein [Cyclobacteriaceae bacterium]|nr:insulinase family protein [Cyclobacteriaceae bacterium]MCH8516454.1 insulinase family protein [Cyclobacteriaceae bacterium]
MIQFEEKILHNGLHVIVHHDPNVSIEVVNVLYKVGSADEDASRTGFAHLFEHLMFGGSENIANFDKELQKAGGNNNAFTSPDITNYYDVLPVQNVDTALWLEADRMRNLSFDPQVLEVQRKVVIEEFKQNYLNQPYGDLWMKFRALCYERHPYQWPTIGKQISHIEEATMEDVKSFFNRFYHPGNAILVLAGKLGVEEAFTKAERWFGDISARDKYTRDLPQEPPIGTRKFQETSAKVAADALYMAFQMPGKKDAAGYASHDLLSDVIGRGKSSRLHKALVREQEVFTQIGAYVTGSADPGLLVIDGKISEGVTLEQAEQAVWAVLGDLADNGLAKNELEKTKRKALTTQEFGAIELLNRAMGLAEAAYYGDTKRVNQESEIISQVSELEVNQIANYLLRPEKAAVLYYRREHN